MIVWHRKYPKSPNHTYSLKDENENCEDFISEYEYTKGLAITWLIILLFIIGFIIYVCL